MHHWKASQFFVNLLPDPFIYDVILTHFHEYNFTTKFWSRCFKSQKSFLNHQALILSDCATIWVISQLRFSVFLCLCSFHWFEVGRVPFVKRWAQEVVCLPDHWQSNPHSVLRKQFSWVFEWWRYLILNFDFISYPFKKHLKIIIIIKERKITHLISSWSYQLSCLVLTHKKGRTLQYASHMDLREIFQNIPDRVTGDHFHVTLL